MLNSRRSRWLLAILVVAGLQVWSHLWAQLEWMPESLRTSATARFKHWEHSRFDFLGGHIDLILSRNNSVPIRAKQMLGDILVVSSTINIPVAEMEQFHAEVRERFSGPGPVSCETLEWFWTRAASLSARAAVYTTSSRPSYEMNVLYKVNCPVSEYVRQRIRESQAQKQQGGR